MNTDYQWIVGDPESSSGRNEIVVKKTYETASLFVGRLLRSVKH